MQWSVKCEFKRKSNPTQRAVGHSTLLSCESAEHPEKRGWWEAAAVTPHHLQQNWSPCFDWCGFRWNFFENRSDTLYLSSTQTCAGDDARVGKRSLPYLSLLLSASLLRTTPGRWSQCQPESEKLWRYKVWLVECYSNCENMAQSITRWRINSKNAGCYSRGCRILRITKPFSDSSSHPHIHFTRKRWTP